MPSGEPPRPQRIVRIRRAGPAEKPKEIRKSHGCTTILLLLVVGIAIGIYFGADFVSSKIGY